MHQTHQVVFLLFDGHLTAIFDATKLPQFLVLPIKPGGGVVATSFQAVDPYIRNYAMVYCIQRTPFFNLCDQWYYTVPYIEPVTLLISRLLRKT